MKPKDQLIKEIEKLEKIGKKPSSRMNFETGEMITKFYRNPKGIMTKKDVLFTINKFMKNYKLVKEGDLLDKEDLKILEAHLMEGAEEYIPSILRKLKKNIKEKGIE